MSIDMGNPGIAGFGGYGNQGHSGQDYHQPRADNDQSSPPAPGPSADARPAHASADPQPGNGASSGQPANGGASASTHNDADTEIGEEAPLDFKYDETVPGFEASASDALNRALKIARSLNHTSLSSDHLMLALTMDPNARRLLERAGDIAQLREAAMRRLGKMHSRFSTGESFPSQTFDLVDIRKAAREAAAEREQLVAISDLINAFPRVDGRLTYGAKDNSSTVAVIKTIEQGLVPHVADAMTRIEALVRDALQRQQSVQSMLQDLSSTHWEETERRQREFMDEVRRQVRESADVQLSAALKDFGEKADARIAELTSPPKTDLVDEHLHEHEVEHESSAAENDETLQGGTTGQDVPPTQSRGYWSWLVL